MKTLFIEDIKKNKSDCNIELLGWIKNKRKHGNLIFFDIVDSTGLIQGIVNSENSFYEICKKVKVESSVRIEGTLLEDKSVEIEKIEVIGDTLLNLDPKPRSEFNISNKQFVDLNLSHRHLYIRNERMTDMFKARHIFMGLVHEWFREHGFIEINAPVLTKIPLYEDRTAMSLKLYDHDVFLTQCVAFYLESAMFSFEKVYNLGPSFRAETGKSRRHLAEYWHIKAEIAWTQYEDIIKITEEMIRYYVKEFNNRAKDIIKKWDIQTEDINLMENAFPRLDYGEAVQLLKDKGFDITWGRSFNGKEQDYLSSLHSTPFWITHIPRSIEPFPYKINPENNETCLVADLMAPNGFGELLGIAEKISDPEELSLRMKEKGKQFDERYDWYKDLRMFGSIPHCGVGMGLERVLRWLIKADHVRDMIPFPRLFGRQPQP